MPHTSCGQDECTFGKVEVESTGLYLLPHSFDPTGTDSRPRCNIRSPTKQPTVALDDTDTDADARKQMQKKQRQKPNYANTYKFVDMLKRQCRLIIHCDVKHVGCGYTERMFQNKNLHTSITKPVTA